MSSGKKTFDKMVKSNIQPEVQFRVDRTGVKNLQDMVVSESFKKSKVFRASVTSKDCLSRTSIVKRNWHSRKEGLSQKR